MNLRTAILIILLGLLSPARAEFKAYWYVLHDTHEGTYKDYYGGIDPKTYQGILPDHIVIENIGNRSPLPGWTI